MDDDSGGLYHKETGKASEDSETPNSHEGGFYRQSRSGSDGVSKESLSKAEGGKVSGISTLEKITPVGKTLSYISKHKKGGAIAGGGATGLMIGVVLLFGFLAAHELQTIQQDLQQYERKAVSYVVKKAANNLLGKLYCRSQSLSSAAVTATQCVKVVAAENDVNGQDETNTDPIAKSMDDLNLDDPAIESGLKNEGIGVEQHGSTVQLEDLNTGDVLNYGDFSNADITARIDTAIPADDVGQIKAARSMATLDELANWNPIPNPDDNADQDVQKDVAGTAVDENAQLADAEEESNDAAHQTKVEVQTNTEMSGAIEDELNTVNKDIANGVPEPQAINDAEKTADLGNTLTLTAIIGTLCSIQKAAAIAAKARIPTIIAYLTRHASTLLSFADEQKISGKVSGTQISDVTKLFNGVPNNKYDPHDETEREAGMSFDQSAAWQRISGNPVNNNQNSKGYTPDMDPAVKPTKDAGQEIINNINNILHVSGVGFICNLISNSIFGFITSFVGVIATIGADTISFGTAQILISGATVSFAEVSQHIIIPEIVKYFTPVAMDGLENSVQWMNNADAGTNIMENMYMQRIGGKPLSTTQAATLYSKGSQLANIEEENKSFSNRLFAISNPDSLISKIAITLPMNKVSMASTVFGDILNSPVLLFHSLAGIFDHSVVLADQPTDPGAPYGITQYGFDDSEITKYDPINNEKFLFHTVVPYGGNQQTVIQLLGDPNQYTNGTPDPSTTDLLHCYAMDQTDPEDPGNSTSILSEEQSDQNYSDPICGTMGNLSSDTTPVPIDSTMVADNVICPELQNNNQTPACETAVKSFLDNNDVLTRYRQYILDDEVMGYIGALQSTST